MDAIVRIGRLAKYELLRASGHADRKSLLTFLVLALVVGGLTPLVLDRGLDFDRGLYRVHVPDDHFLFPVVASDPVFRRVHLDEPYEALRSGEVDLVIWGPEARAADSEKGHAALAALEKAARHYTLTLMSHEADAGAAFPVRVLVDYAPQAREARPGPLPMQPPPPSGDAEPLPEPRADAPGSTREPAPGEDSTSGDGTAPPPVVPSRGFDFFTQGGSVPSPAALTPPFPFQSLLLAYLFLIPMNFVAQMYASSMINERLNRRGELLLASPVRPWEIVVGKTLPYLVGLVAVTALLAVVVGGSWITLLAMLPVALVFLALEFQASLIARSFRELTFLTVFASVFVTMFCFLPAVFSDIHPIALISPITLIVMDLKGEAVGLGAFLYATLPLTLASFTLFLLGTTLVREEELFHHRKPVERFLDAVARVMPRPSSALWVTALLVPFAFIAELFLVTLLFAWPFGVTIPLVFLAIALVEEAFKASPAFAAFRSRRMRPTRRNAIILGVASGIGFFVAEKLVLIVGLAALLEIDAGATVFGIPDLGLPLPVLLLMPLALHVVTATCSSLGAAYAHGECPDETPAERPRRKAIFGLTWILAVLIHVLYNLAVMSHVGGI